MSILTLLNIALPEGEVAEKQMFLTIAVSLQLASICQTDISFQNILVLQYISIKKITVCVVQKGRPKVNYSYSTFQMSELLTAQTVQYYSSLPSDYNIAPPCTFYNLRHGCVKQHCIFTF